MERENEKESDPGRDPVCTRKFRLHQIVTSTTGKCADTPTGHATPYTAAQVETAVYGFNRRSTCAHVHVLQSPMLPIPPSTSHSLAPYISRYTHREHTLAAARASHFAVTRL